MPAGIDIEFTHLKDTKNTYCYKEVAADPSQEKVGSIYLKKSVFDGARPDRIKVTIKAV